MNFEFIKILNLYTNRSIFYKYFIPLYIMYIMYYNIDYKLTYTHTIYNMILTLEYLPYLYIHIHLNTHIRT